MPRSINLKMVAVIAVAIVAVVVIYPGALRYAGFALFLACPLMMLLMMGGHGGHAGHGAGQTPSETGGYVCPMHPEITSSFAARCPRCGMNLERRAQPAQGLETARHAEGAKTGERL